MKKLDRVEGNYGSGGGGSYYYESDLFSVIFWNKQQGKITELTCNIGENLEIYFEGHVKDLCSDEFCMTQLNFNEIIDLIEYQKLLSYKEGRNDKSKEIKKCLKEE